MGMKGKGKGRCGSVKDVKGRMERKRKRRKESKRVEERVKEGKAQDGREQYLVGGREGVESVRCTK